MVFLERTQKDLTLNCPENFQIDSKKSRLKKKNKKQPGKIGGIKKLRLKMTTVLLMGTFTKSYHKFQNNNNYFVNYVK